MTASRRERPPGPLPRVGPDPPRRKGRMYPPPTGGGRPRSPSQERRPLDPPPPHGGNLEGDLEPGELRVTRQERLRRAAHAAALLRADRLQGIAEAVARARLHLAEDDPPAPPQNEVELVPPCSLVPGEQGVPAQPVVQEHAGLGPAPVGVHDPSPSPSRSEGE